MFGQTTNKTPFGTSTFGATAGGGFGATSATTPFGQQTTPSLFGTKTPGTTFGTPSAFGAQTPAAGTLFGAAATQGATTGTGAMFGQTTGFGAAPAATSGTSGFNFGGAGAASKTLFGAASATQTSSIFGAPQTTSSGMFGQPQGSTGSIFGQPAASSSTIFGASGTAGFGTTAPPVGTTLKFAPPAGQDNMMKGGTSHTINTRHQCITAMKEYESKSIEELRCDDYLSNRKGPGAGGLMMGAGLTQPDKGVAGGSLFGATGTAAGVLGQTTAGGFRAATGTTGFGTGTTSLFGQQQPATTGGLFGNKTAFGTATTSAGGSLFGTATNTFGQPQQQKTLFGAQPSQTGIFGSTATSTASAFGTATPFGQQAPAFGQQPQQAAGSLFGKPATGFPTTTTTSLPGFNFGTAANTGTNLFAAKPTGFGTTAAPSTAFGTGAAGTSLFGNKLAGSTFGTLGATAPTAGFGTGLQFGAPGGTTTTTNSLFNKPFGGTGFMGLGTTGLGTGTMTSLGGVADTTSLGTDPNVAAVNDALLRKYINSLALSSPYGDNPLFRLPLKTEDEEGRLRPTSSLAQKATLSTPPHYKLITKTRSKLQLQSRQNQKKELFEGLDDDDSLLATQMFVPRKSIKKLVIKKSNKSPPQSLLPRQRLNRDLDDLVSPLPLYPQGPDDDDYQGENPPQRTPDSVANGSGDNSERSARKLTPKQPDLDSTITALNPKPPSQGPAPPPEERDTSAADTSPPTAPAPDDLEACGTPWTPNPAGVILKRQDYYTLPPLKDLTLDDLDEDGNCFLENFTVGREGYGSVFFPGVTNVTRLDLDEIVHIRRKEITVYPDDDKKPPYGEGLNKRAEVTLDCTWPMDKTTHKPIKSLERLRAMNYAQKIEAATAKLGATFIEYRHETGSWVFEVPHFSKFALPKELGNNRAEEGGAAAAGQATEKKHLETASLDGVKPKQPQQRPGLGGTGPGEGQEDAAPEGAAAWSDSTRGSAAPLAPEDDEMMRDDDYSISSSSSEAGPGMAMEDDREDDGGDGGPGQQLPASHKLAASLGMDSHRLQVMKASFFGGDDEVDMDTSRAFQPVFAPAAGAQDKPLKWTQLGAILKPKPLGSPLKYFASAPARSEDKENNSQSYLPGGLFLSTTTTTTSTAPGRLPRQTAPSLSMPRPLPLPTAAAEGGQLVGSRRQKLLLPLPESVLCGRERMLADAGLSRSRSFRVGWGPGCTLLHTAGPALSPPGYENRSDSAIPFSLLPGNPFISNLKESPFKVVVRKVNMEESFQGAEEKMAAHQESLLRIQLSHSQYSLEDSCPVFSLERGVDALHRYAEASGEEEVARYQGHAAMVWSLCVALWGRLDMDHTDSLKGYELRIARRNAVSKWLANNAKDRIRKEVEASKFKDEGEVGAIYSLLSGRQIAEAAQLSQKSKHYQLALLLSQAIGNFVARRLIAKQLYDWEELKADQFIGDDLLRVYSLLAGHPVWPSSKGNINTCENLDWKRAFATHLWYVCSPVSSVADGLQMYEDAFRENGQVQRYSVPPLPPYLEDSAAAWGLQGQQDEEEEDEMYAVRDMCYHLLKLYSQRSHRLERTLAPTTSTPYHLDYRLSWHVFQVLGALGYTHLSQQHTAMLHTSYAAQLESAGLWHWAIFVLLHIGHRQRREAAVKEVLCRHCNAEEKSAESKRREELMIEHFHIPPEWIHEAKALRAKYEKKPQEEALHRLKACQWNDCHTVLLTHLASDAIINEDYDYLMMFLEELEPQERSLSIQDWNFGGKIYLDYIRINKSIQDLQEQDEPSVYELEKLIPEVTSLCSRIDSLPCNNARDVLCQSEIARRTANILKAVVSLRRSVSDDEGKSPSRFLIMHISKLPMPPDYIMHELQDITEAQLVST